MLPLETTTNYAQLDADRLHRLQEKLEALMLETRLLRQRLEALFSAHQLAWRKLREKRPRHRDEDLSRANRLF
jgi:hypothetical protein